MTREGAISTMSDSTPLDHRRLASTHAQEHLRARLRTVVDFPKPGIGFKDITPLIADAQCLHMVLDLLVQPFIGRGITAVVAMEARGFIFGGALAARLNAGFVPVRKPGKLPAEVDAIRYELEYGHSELQMHKGSLHAGSRVLIADDLLATGGTAVATAELVRGQGASIEGFVFVVELDFLHGRRALQSALGDDLMVHVLLHELGE